jgi:hypothetical protein
VQSFGDGERVPYESALGMSSLRVELGEIEWKSHPHHLKIMDPGHYGSVSPATPARSQERQNARFKTSEKVMFRRWCLARHPEVRDVIR